MKFLLSIIITTIFSLSHADFISDCLDEHNKYGAALGIPPYTWSCTLMEAAQTWADYLAQNHLFQHSKGRVNVGENIAEGSASQYGTIALIDMWVEEKQYFIPGQNFPDCSTTGSYADVGHWTQMIWRKSTELGCGTATSSGQRYLVCQYSPAGNILGQPVY